MVWGVYRFRVQQIRAALKNRFEERLSERTRIAQDLHDELLQSALGVSLQVELTDALVEDRHPAKPYVERALTLSRTLLQKGREVLRDLRETTTMSTTSTDACRKPSKTFRPREVRGPLGCRRRAARRQPRSGRRPFKLAVKLFAMPFAMPPQRTSTFISFIGIANFVWRWWTTAAGCRLR